jgi:hypothetical protein
MTDTPPHIKKLQLKIWLSKPPMERLKQFLLDTEALYLYWNNAKDKKLGVIRQTTNRHKYEKNINTSSYNYYN